MPGKILIIDGIATNRIGLRVRLCSAYYDVIQAATGAEGRALISTVQPDMVLIATSLPDMTASHLCKAIRKAPIHCDIPIVVLECAPTRDLRLELLGAGADDVLDRNVAPPLMLARLRSLLRSGNSREDLQLHSQAVASTGFAEPCQAFEQPAHVAILADDTATALTWKKRLERERPYRFSLHSPRRLPRAFTQARAPDVILIMTSSDEEDDVSASLLSTLGAQPGFRRCRFLVSMQDETTAHAVQMLDLGAHDMVFGPFDAAEISLRLDQLLRRKARADQMHERLQDGLHAALVDPLTGLHNRRFAEPELQRLIENTTGEHGGVAVMLADLDHFKRINDQYGHAVGDKVLTEVARRLLGVIGPGDLVARIGGEEFLIASPNLCQRQATQIAHHLCRAIGDTPIPIPGLHPPINVTVSIGLTMFDVSEQSQFNGLRAHNNSPDPVTTLLARADQALYGAKTLGRNQVTTLERPTA
jgi:two-component system cell cycle response regulator